MDWLPLKAVLTVVRLRLLVLMLVLAVFCSAMAVVYVAHLNRQAFNQSQTELNHKNKMQEEWGQLLLQYSTLTAHGQIERQAVSRLRMEMLHKDKVILVEP